MRKFATIAGIASLLVMMAVMPWWNQGMSIASFGIMGAWLLHRLLDTRTGIPFKQQLPDKTLLLFAALFALPIYGLLFTENFQYATWDLRMKLPLLLIPIGLSGLHGITPRVQRAAWGVFILSCAVAALVCTLVYTGHYNSFAHLFGWKTVAVHDGRDASIFISHIRLGLMIVLSIAALTWMQTQHTFLRVLRPMLIAAFLIFLWLLQSVTSFALLTLLVLYFIARWWLFSTHVVLKTSAVAAFLATLAVPSIFIYHKAKAYFYVNEQERNEVLEATTARGEQYVHFAENTLVENGHYILRYIAWNELKNAWNARSSIPFDSTDALGNPIKGTLVRYLTSRALRKDQDGVNALTDDDVKHIESGITNAQRLTMNGLDRRLERLFFEWNSYRNGADPNGHSMMQRWLFWQAGWHIWKAQPWTGTGTGDVQDAYQAYYASNHSLLHEKNRLRAHNQFLTMLVAFGIPGAFFFVWVWWKLWQRMHRAPIAACAVLIILASFISEDTLETQAGVTFVSVFVVFTFLYPNGGTLFREEFPNPRPARDAHRL